MGIVSIDLSGRVDVAEADGVQLLLAPSSCCIDGKQDRPDEQTSDETDDGRHFEVAKEEIAVKGLMIEDVAVGHLDEGANPIEEAIGQFG